MQDIGVRRRDAGVAVHRRHIIQDLFNYNSAAPDVHHPICHAGRRNFLLAFNTGVGSQHHREDAYDRHAHQLSTKRKGAAKSSPVTRHGAAAHNRARAKAERRSRRGRRTAGPGAGRRRPQRARREDRRARRKPTRRSLEDKLKEDAKHRQMAELYRQHVLKEAPKPPVIQIQGLKKSQPTV